jgi:hypothetical protein
MPSLIARPMDDCDDLRGPAFDVWVWSVMIWLVFVLFTRIVIGPAILRESGL